MSWKPLRSAPDPNTPGAQIHRPDSEDEPEEAPVQSEPTDELKGFLDEHY